METSTQPEPSSAPKGRVSRLGLYLPLGLLALAMLVWSGVWFFARGKAGELMDAWMAREARLGRQWTCPDRGIGGFPFRIDLTCANPTFVSPQGDGALERLIVTARVLDPKQIIAVFTGPLTAKTGNGDTVQLAFDDARASYRGSPDALDQASVVLIKPVLTLTAAGQQPVSAASSQTEIHLRAAPVAEPATDIAVTSSDIRSDLLDALAGNALPAKFEARARVAGLRPGPIRNWKETAESWRRAAGDARIESFAFTKGPMGLNVSGTVALDDQRRLQGEIKGTATGAERILKLFGVDLGGGANLLGALFGGNKSGTQGTSVPIMLRMDGGRLFFGPIPGPRLRPLYTID